MHRRTLYSIYCTGLGLAALLIVGVVALSAMRQEDGDASPIVPTTVPSPTESASPGENEVVPVSSPTPGEASTPTPPVSTGVSLPDSATSVIGQFYQAYKAGNASAIQPYFTEDTDKELQSLRSRLFTGVDTNGIPGGPTLFATNSANQQVSAYTVKNATENGGKWMVTVDEVRVQGNGNAAPGATTMLQLIPSGDTWKIDAYYRSGESGKYNAFLTP